MAVTVTKSYIDSIVNGMNILPSKPAVPAQGDAYFDMNNMQTVIYSGNRWIPIAGSMREVRLEPTHAELEKHPALKQAWEEYIVIRKLVGLPV